MKIFEIKQGDTHLILHTNYKKSDGMKLVITSIFRYFAKQKPDELRILMDTLTFAYEAQTGKRYDPQGGSE